MIAKELKKMISLAGKIIQTRVVIFELRTTISCNSRLVSTHFSGVTHDDDINCIAISRS